MTSLAGFGSYDVSLALNAAFESERVTGTLNDSTGTAEDLDPSAVSLGAGIDRLAVVGVAGPSEDDFYRFTLAGGETASLALASDQWW